MVKPLPFQFTPACLAGLALGWALLGRHLTGAGFPVNDFWQLFDQASTLAWQEPASWFNGFFPIGYPLLLAIGPGPLTPDTAWALHLGVVTCLVWGIASLLHALRGPWAAWLGAGLTLFSPGLITYVLTPGPDLAAAAAIAWALVAFHRAQEAPGASWAALLGGLCLAVALLLRGHLLVLALAMLLAGGLLGYLRAGGPLRWATLGVGAGVLIHGLLQTLAGHGPFETAQAFNIYRQVYPVSWWDPPRQLDVSVWSMVAEAKLRYLDATLRGVPWLFPSLLPALLMGCLAPVERGGALGRFLFLSGLPYALAVSLALSERAPIPLLPIWVVATALLVVELMAQLRAALPVPGTARWATALGVTCFAATVLLASVRQDWMALRQLRHTSDVYAQLEALARQHGVTRAEQIFSDNHEIYFLGLPGWRPSTNGTWGVLPNAVWQYERRHPRFDVQSWPRFLADCRRRDVRLLMLTPDAHSWQPYFSALLRHVSPFVEQARPIGAVGEFEVFRL
ncbi:MAG: hypothetical protein VKP62_05760 [Candidatus Sericytochromatia bacterium]|nr:hypothetical protein [Candidatus Sericytochromatia bacterium]